MTHQPPIEGMDCPEPVTTADQDERNAWHHAAHTAIVEYARRGQPFTIYEAARHFGVGEPHHPNMWGILTAELHREGVISPYSFTTGGRPSVASSAVRTWVAA
ncbi:hypothetical protein [Embleya sp. NPDC005971]|uniref:hypothetical protein n=1 Tax=Embleya sp. NPDC005971 TaxID=3156724 RepID=UPI0033D6C811